MIVDDKEQEQRRVYLVDELEAQTRGFRKGVDPIYDKRWDEYQKDLLEQTKHIRFHNRNRLSVGVSDNMYLRFMRLKILKFNYISRTDLLRNLIYNWIYLQENKYKEVLDAYLPNKQ